ncbi:hypothetical protein C1N83_25935 [Priestia aryabhattai]
MFKNTKELKDSSPSKTANNEFAVECKLTSEEIEKNTNWYYDIFLGRFDYFKNKDEFTLRTISERTGLGASTIRAALSRGSSKKLSFSSMVAVASVINKPLSLMFTPIEKRHKYLETRGYNGGTVVVYGMSTGGDYRALWIVKLVDLEGDTKKIVPLLFETTNHSISFETIEESLFEFLIEQRLKMLVSNDYHVMDYSFEEYETQFWDPSTESKHLNLMVERIMNTNLMR